jgi:4-diphosphocytidyl-2-C-methyl-D-erythritol kinase
VSTGFLLRKQPVFIETQSRYVDFHTATSYSLLKKVSEEMLKIRAPAKINLHLAIKDQRPDGFHNLESIFMALDFGDSLCFELAKTERQCLIETNWRVSGELAVPPEKNIVFKAVSLFRERSGFTRGLRVSIDKRIPLGAGLGGGSSDAAAALLALNTLSGAGLSAAALEALAQRLGSDVPFFLKGGVAWVSGRGERIQPVDAPRGLSVVLVNPGFASNTGEAFGLLDKAREEKKLKTLADDMSAEHLISALKEEPARWPYRNDFLPVFLAAGKVVYGKILAGLRELGADFCALSGSGSTCFGIFRDEGAASRAVEALRAAGSEAGSEAGSNENVVCQTFPLAY